MGCLLRGHARMDLGSGEMLFHPDLGEMRVWIQMTGGLDGSSQETKRLMSERAARETWPQEQMALIRGQSMKPKSLQQKLSWSSQQVAKVVKAADAPLGGAELLVVGEVKLGQLNRDIGAILVHRLIQGRREFTQTNNCSDRRALVCSERAAIAREGRQAVREAVAETPTSELPLHHSRL
ncbi:hypothetical protein INR49_027473 [Caranx melampygus]|nr:hypothetical protein INR49_027473 [Caranx melampygus]